MGILDPHKYTSFSESGQKAGLDESFSSFMKYPGHSACFNGIFGLDTSAEEYPGSLFRFPLRKPGANSEISRVAYSTERVLENLYESFYQEAPIILLFLKHVQEISLYDGNDLVCKVAIDPDHSHVVTLERSECRKCTLGLSRCVLRAYSVTVQVHKRNTNVQHYHWLIINVIGQCTEQSSKLGFLPWVGIAAPLPSKVNLSNLYTETDIEKEGVEHMMKDLATSQIWKQLSDLRTSLVWKDKFVSHNEGHTFCFLPLPGTTSLPVNVHGYFAIADNRRSILWPCHDDMNDRALWNRYLVTTLIPPAYSVLLTIRSSLLSYIGTPLPMPVTENDITHPYAAWPLYSKVNSSENWKELIKPTLERICSEKILWTAAMEGKWVAPTEALFLPQTESSQNTIPDVVIEVLIDAGEPVVSLPHIVRDTLQQMEIYSQLLSQNIVTPGRVRVAIRSDCVHDLIKAIAKDRKKAAQLLQYILVDVNRRNSDELHRLKLLPVATGKCTTFSNNPDIKKVFALHSSELIIDILRCLPGMEERFVDYNLQSSLLTRLNSLGEEECLQLRCWAPESILKHLLPTSLRTWSSNDSGGTVTWQPGKNGHPPISWLRNLWDHFCKYFPVLKCFEGLPVVPVEEINHKKIKHITLVPLPEMGLTYFLYNCRTMAKMSTILGKLGARVIHHNSFVFNHPDIYTYIRDIDITTVLSFLLCCQEMIADFLDMAEKSVLRRELARNCDADNAGLFNKFRSFLVELPIFSVGVGATKQCLAPLRDSDGSSPALVLPAEGIQFSSLIQYPPNILSTEEPSVVNLIQCLGQTKLSFYEICSNCIIPFALSQCKQSREWCNGDELFVWILSRDAITTEICRCLGDTSFVRTQKNPNVFVKPCQLFSYEKEFQKMFSIERDQVFACTKYKEKNVFEKFELCGLQTWKSLISCPQKLAVVLKERAKSVSHEKAISIELAYQRSQFVFETAAKYQLVKYLEGIPFLFSQKSSPSSYPAGLRWYGANDSQLHALGSICVPKSSSAFLVGTVKPVLQSNYSFLESLTKYFYQPNVADVIFQLSELVKIPQLDCSDSVTAISQKVYDFLSCHTAEFSQKDLPKNWILWTNEQGKASFRLTSEFVIDSSIYLSPFLLSISSNPFLSKYTNLFRKMGVQGDPTNSKLLDILVELSQTSELSEDQVELTIRILNCLFQRKYSGEVLVLTDDKTLKPAKECVFKDRQWVEQNDHCYSFVHDGIPIRQALYFGVERLSHILAPSEMVAIPYEAAGPHEPITRRISGIVQDYCGNIDIFKELIQNADDAKATEVKFVIDWREHGKEKLLTEELRCWQGPALLAYNNAVFSDKDLKNICQLACESKMNDPIKIGRFGLGFCSTYYLTDVPSFVSQRCFTIFDPHTWYLKDWISSNQPGMMIDIVKCQRNLSNYKDQLSPFDGLFGCNIFKLEEEGYSGTIFRFPFRNRDCKRSKICSLCLSRKGTDDLVRCLQSEASTIVLFLKHVKLVEVSVLDNTTNHPLDMKKLFSVNKQSTDMASRLKLIQSHRSQPEPICSSCVIEFNQLHTDAKHIQLSESHHYLLSSSLSPAVKISKQHDKISLAEIAVEVIEKDKLLLPMPVQNALLFCFLPLPIQSHLPFHVNGFFDVGKDRRNLTVANDSDGWKWNVSLIEGAVPLALECLIAHLVTKCNLHDRKVEERDSALRRYSTLWLGHDDNTNRGVLANKIVNFSMNHLAKSNKSIVWCDIGDGRWLRPCDVYLFDAEALVPEGVRKQAVTVLLDNNYPVLPNSTPSAIADILKAQLDQLKHVFTYERFFREIFVPKIESICPTVRKNQLMFVLKNYQIYSKQFIWVKTYLASMQCIPAQCTEALLIPAQLIDSRQPVIACLYTTQEGRFPNETLIEDKDVMKTLTEFGMITDNLPITELVERAKTVAVLAAKDESKGMQRMEALFNYLVDVEWKSQFLNIFDVKGVKDKENRVAALWNVCFLKTKLCPSGVSLPWCSMEQFVSPSQVFSLNHSALVFSQKPVVEFLEAQRQLVNFLGIDKNEPQLKVVLDHVCKIISFLQENPSNRTTSNYLDKVFCSVYEYLAKKSAEKSDVIKQALEGQKWIWQDGCLLFPRQVLIEWKYNHYPYLCKLSKYSDHVKNFFQLLGVEEKATVGHLIDVLEQVKVDGDTNRLSSETIEFVIQVLRVIDSKLQKTDQVCVLVLTAEGKLKPAKECVFDDREWLKQKVARIKHHFTFVHCGIPTSQAQKFGVQPLSLKITPSRKLTINYKAAGPHESITRRISGIVADYSGNIDIFKELIQNADDAKATKIKFVIDWRQHGKKQLLTEELGCWQGPALLAYNNATFSEEDFDSLCKIANESKMNDPLKTGRFGVGFCSTYCLTDVPSFVSQRSFTIFDPHTWYLKDRVSYNQPGMMIDIVDNQEYLNIFEHQFVPYDGIFGCNIFKLQKEGFLGTLFRFPFRTRDCRSSEICKKCPSRRYISDLVQNFQCVASSILLFLKNIEEIEVFVIDSTTCHPSDMNNLFSVSKQSADMASRLKLIQNHRSLPQPVCSSCVIEFKQISADSKQTFSVESHKYLIASALSPTMSDLNQPGMIPLGEVAVEVLQKDQFVCPVPPRNALLFCFLPLPIQSHLPFHVNGFFDVGKDRRNLTVANDSDGWKWNVSLIEGAVPLALECLIAHLVTKCNLHDRKVEERDSALRRYSTLWLGHDDNTNRGVLANKIVNFSMNHLAKSNKSIVWCDIGDGRWLRPCDVYLFDAETLLPEEALIPGEALVSEEVRKQAITVLLDNNYPVLPISTPSAITGILKEQLSHLKHVFTYEKFFREIFLPNIQFISETVRNNQLIFVLKYYRPHSMFSWVKDLLVTTKCIPVQCTNILVKIEELINPHQSLIAALYSPDEGRFPNEIFAKDRFVMETLEKFGMICKSLPVTEVVKRAKTVAVIAAKEERKGLQRMLAILRYLYHDQLNHGQLTFRSREIKAEKERNDRIGALWNIRFLKAKPCPFSDLLPWCASEPFVSPSQLFSLEYSSLVFSQKPVVEFSEGQSQLVECLGISKNVPQLELVLKHFCHLISYVQKHPANKQTSHYLDHVFDSIYDHLSKTCEEKLDLIKQTLDEQRWIWQDGCLLSSKQVLMEWNYSFYPYLCKLPNRAGKVKTFFQFLGIKEKATVDCLIDVLKQVKIDAGTNPLSDETMKFVIHVLGELHSTLKTRHRVSVLVLTTDRLLMPAKDCVFDDREWVKRKASHLSHRFTFIDENISAVQSRHFGVEPLSHKVAPSQKLAIDYKLAGPREPITRRISGIVKDYSGNIDIFKELIQNADDAKATEVKFVIDWREHGKEQLLTEELGCWQGPALLAYNNAVFSDEDFHNICQLAGESKLNDPLKIGRFGLGFCSTYYLTDVPSFISQQYFAMFDPHTWYLKDRVTYSEPGIKINLAKLQEDLLVYEDQFVPFDGFFGCDIFKLQEKGFSGTIFRFPFRTDSCEISKICKTCFSEKDIDDLVKNFQREALNLLLFLKNVVLVEVYVLDKGARHPSDMKNLFTVSKQSTNITGRLQMITSHESQVQPVCSSCVIEVKQSAVDSRQTQSVESHHYVIASALSPTARTVTMLGIIPLAEVAVEVVKENKLLLPMPVQNALLFCFLPLPIPSHLPFHVNGFFDVGKDRRNLTIADDSDGCKWNSSLVKEAVPLALECLIAHFAEKCNLRDIKVEERGSALQHYSTLWLGHDGNTNRGVLANSIVNSSQTCLAKSNQSIVWCDIGEGKWLRPHDVYLFTKEFLSDEVWKQAITLLLDNNYPVLPISTPSAITDILKKQLDRLNHVFSYKKFFSEIFLPKIETISAVVRNNQLLFVLKSFQGRQRKLRWAKHMLSSTKCIPTQCTDVLVKPAQLIDPRQSHIASMYSQEEGKFPCLTFVKDNAVMNTLADFGMVHEILHVSELQQRAKTVATLSESKPDSASVRIEQIFKYLINIEPRTPDNDPASMSAREERIKALWDICFLEADPCPSGVCLPWCHVAQLVSPSQVSSSMYSPLVFSQKPVIEFSDKNCMLVEYLGICRNTPELTVVLNHVLELINFIQKRESIDKETCLYLDNVFQTIYMFLAEKASGQEKKLRTDIKKRLKGLNWIWQDGHLLSSNQVVNHWKYRSSLCYLCELSQVNKNEKFQCLFQLLGVQAEATVQRLLDILKRVKCNFGDKPLSSEVLEFVVDVVRFLNSNHKHVEQCEGVDVLLPDENAVLQPVSLMTCDSKLGEWVQKLAVYNDFLVNGGQFLHPDIPREHGLKLGAQPIIDALLKEIEDDNFLDGTDFGQVENLVDRLNSILEKYSDDAAIVREFVQNADDAQASELLFVLDHRDNFPDQTLFKDSKQWKELQKVPALCIFNNRPFSEKDLQGICQLGRGGKSFSSETIGRFGIGFNVAYHLTDCPMFIIYNSASIPTDFCVFDPLCYYLPESRKKPTGRRWKITNDHINQFPDQFQPFLHDMLSDFRALAPQCLKDLSHGYVVFRLPLVRKQCDSDNMRVLCKGKSKSLTVIQNIFVDLQSTANEILLFLSHVQSISYFEIFSAGDCFHHFTSVVKNICTMTSPREGIYQLAATCVETVKGQDGRRDSNYSNSKWLLHRQVGFKIDHSELCLKAGNVGLKPLGGVAAQLECTSQRGRLFCFLPMLSLSGVPVHLNAHFLVDDSRKHLTTIKGLEHWNSTISSDILVPSYVELLLSAREHVTGTQESIKWFYGLFPNLSSTSTIDTVNSETSNMREVIGRGLYQCLLENNCAVLLDQRSIIKHGSLNWLSLAVDRHSSVGYFCKSLYSDSIQMTIKSELRSVLLSLGMPITCAEEYVFHGFCEVSQQYRKSMEGLITPDKVLNFIKILDLSKQPTSEVVIKQNCELLLEFIFQRSDYLEVKNILVGVPLLLSMADTLETSGSLFSSRFAQLLPHCQEYFINPRLEKPDSALSIQLRKAQVIRKLNIEVVAKNIQLSKVTDSVTLSSSESQTVEHFWHFLSSFLSDPSISTAVNDYLGNHPILPTLSGSYYPPVLGKCVFMKMHDSEELLVNFMKKLGYAELDQATIGSSQMHILHVVSSSTSYKDIIRCLCLKPPSIYSVVFTPVEVNSFLSLFIQPNIIPEKVLDCLKKLPLFQTVDGSFISLTGSSICIISSNIPTAGLLALCRETSKIILKAPDAQTEKFYMKIMDYEKYCCTDFEFYLKFLLPNTDRLSDSDLLEHLGYVRGSSHVEHWQTVIATLIKTPLITMPKRGRVRVSELYDPNTNFYATFFEDEVPPLPWCAEKWLPFLRQLGLRTRVTELEWLKIANMVAEETEDPNIKETCRKKCDNLLATLKDMIHSYESRKSKDFLSFLKSASDIPFIYCPAPSKLECLIKTVTRCPVKKSHYHMFTCFCGTASFQDDHLAGLTKVVLPSSCTFVHRIQERRISEALGVQCPLATKTVIDNLLALSSYLCSVNSTVSPSNKETADAFKDLENIFYEHFKFIEDRADERCVDDLLDTRCIFLHPADDSSFILVQPRQLVQHIPSQLTFHPFAYRVPSKLRCFSKLLARLGVQEELTPMHYLVILSNIKAEVDKNHARLSEHKEYLKISFLAFDALIRCLRQDSSDSFSYLTNTKFYLPSQSGELLEARKLVYNDSPWIKIRLQKAIAESYQYKFVKNPPPDENGQSIPPSCLGIKSLSVIAVEKLHSDVALHTNRCISQVLFEYGSRTDQCIWVQALQDRLNSDEFTKGLERLYWHEHGKSPKYSSQFMTALKLLHKCKIKCVHDIKTIICVHSKEVTGTEDSTKLCHFVTEEKSNETLLYITHYSSQFSPELFMHQLAANIVKLMKNLLRNASHIGTILDCPPSDIQNTLDQIQVAPFDFLAADTIASNIDCIIGRKFERHLHHQDFLLICNFTPGELVVFCSAGSGVCQYARVVESNYRPGCDITERYLVLLANENKPPVYASPLQVYKILDMSQRALLWNTSSLAGNDPKFAISLTLADVPHEQVLVKRWLKNIYNTSYLKNTLRLSSLSVRLVTHIHYMFVTLEMCPDLFSICVKEVIKILKQQSSSWSSGNDYKTCVASIELLVKQLTGSSLHVKKIVSPDATLSADTQPLQSLNQPQDVSGQPAKQSTSSNASPADFQLVSPPLLPALPQTVAGVGCQPPTTYPQVSTIGGSRLVQLANSAQNASLKSRVVPTTLQNLCSSTTQPTCPQPTPIDSNKAKMWLVQAKADLLAAHFLHNETTNTDEEDSYQLAGNETDVCRFPALVCFLSHDVVEKCLKGVLYAKRGFFGHLQDSNIVVELMEMINETSDFNQQFKDVVRECAMQINEHVAKSRYPHYQVPPCAPAEVYTVFQAAEALSAATKMMKNAAKLSGIGELVGDLDSLPSLRLTTALSFMEKDQGKLECSIV